MAINRRLLMGMAVATAGSMVLSSCAKNNDSSSGSSGSSSGAGTSTSVVVPSVTQQSAAANVLPPKIKSSGKLIVAVNLPYAPNEYKDSSGKIVGFDVDLMDATAKSLGLTATYREATFDKIVPSVKAGTYDVGMSSFTDNKLREKTVDFVTYFKAGSQWASAKGKQVDPNNACGLKVAVQATTVQDTDDIPARSKKCVAAKRKPITKLKFQSQAEATNALVLGRVDAMAADSPVTAYAVKQAGGKIALAGPIYDAAPYGWAVAKGSKLASAMQKALQSLIGNGTYDKICKKWGVQAGEIKTSVINGATS